MCFKKQILGRFLCTVTVLGLIFTGCSGINKDEVLVDMGEGNTITLGYYNFAARFQQSVFDIYYGSMMGDDMWTQDLGGSSGTMADSIKQSVLDNLKTDFVIKQHAQDYGITISDDEQAKIDAAAQKFISDNKTSAIKELGATEEYVKKYLEDNYYTKKVQKALEEEATPSISDSEATQAAISYMMYSSAPITDANTGEQSERPAEEVAENKKAAEDLAAAEDFDAFLEERGEAAYTYNFTYSADPATDATLGEKVIEAAKKLEVGEVSPVIDVEGVGFYVVRMDSLNDEEATANKREELENQARITYANETISSWEEEITWEVKEDLLSKVKFNKLFTISPAMQDALSEGE